MDKCKPERFYIDDDRGYSRWMHICNKCGEMFGKYFNSMKLIKKCPGCKRDIKWEI